MTVLGLRGPDIFLSRVEPDVIRFGKVSDELTGSTSDVHDSIRRSRPDVTPNEFGPGSGPSDQVCEEAVNAWNQEDRVNSSKDFRHSPSLSAPEFRIDAEPR